ncbi:hypothetical protein SETIT_9G119300v2 [Setaria italica]|uniref:Reverse transcriptase zinc-binding domain-containing protein n=1 Tax=Setaria italica TaxID=4555 RepID=A0A368SFV1_SETIT|nr:hypothetical protein SETIT_9G119300v2 [Setaria italica]
MAISSSSVGSGTATSFWHDNWLPVGRLSEAMPARYSHSTAPDAVVAAVLGEPLRDHLVPRLTRVAAAELAALEELLQPIELSGDADIRSCPLAAPDGVLRAGPLYRATMAARSGSAPKVRFFGWLLVQGRIQCKTNLLLKKVVDNDRCEPPIKSFQKRKGRP